VPFYDFTREPAREFSLAELVAKISELERRRQREGRETPGDGDENPWRGRRADRDATTRADEPELLQE
jgi:hypothetical protein